jgi:hypothetical protein
MGDQGGEHAVQLHILGEDCTAVGFAPVQAWQLLTDVGEVGRIFQA